MEGMKGFKLCSQWHKGWCKGSLRLENFEVRFKTCCLLCVKRLSCKRVCTWAHCIAIADDYPHPRVLPGGYRMSPYARPTEGYHPPDCKMDVKVNFFAKRLKDGS